jgi:hypothetical protein
VLIPFVVQRSQSGLRDLAIHSQYPIDFIGLQEVKECALPSRFFGGPTDAGRENTVSGVRQWIIQVADRSTGHQRPRARRLNVEVARFCGLRMNILRSDKRPQGD